MTIRVTTVLALATSAFAPLFGSEITLNERVFQVADGFELTLVTTTDATMRPVNVSFDEQRRLYVTESSGSNEPTKIQLQNKPHSVLRLADSDDDGVFDNRTVFAQDMMFPEGCLWFEGSLYVAAPPQIWKLTDTTGDGRADKRDVWFDGKTLTGCANDLHGPYLGRDGQIYWCKGAFAEQTYERPGKRPFVTKASHIFRANPDGTEIEHVMTGGMDNPVDVAFSQTGERFFTTTFLQHPSGGRRDGIIHAIYGGVYGKDHAVIHGHIRTGELMPPLIHLGAAAPSGLESIDLKLLYGETRIPSGVDCALVSAQFNKHRIGLHLLREHGATYKSEDVDLLVCSHPDFHPTDVLQDSDGSLLIVDTGGWFKLCCPTSQMKKPDVPGAIYRLRSVAPGKLPGDPDWDNLSTIELANRLASPRPDVVERSIRLLARRNEAVSALKPIIRHESERVRSNAIWTLCRIGSPETLSMVGAALRDDASTKVRCAAAHVLGLHRDARFNDALLDALQSNNAHLSRAVSEAMGRIRSAEFVPALLQFGAFPADRTLQHSLMYALIEIGDTKATRAGLASAEAGTQRAALIALDQMEGGNLAASDVVDQLTSANPELAATARWIAQQHPEWSREFASWATVILKSGGGDQIPAGMLSNIAADHAAQDAMLRLLLDQRTPALSNQIILEAFAALPSDMFADETTDKLRSLSLPRELGLARTTALAATLNQKKPDSKTVAALFQIANEENTNDATRLAALEAIATTGTAIDDPSLSFLLSHVDASRGVFRRTQAAAILASSRLSLDQRTAVANRFPSAGIPEARSLLSVFEKQQNEHLGLTLVKRLGQSDALNGIHPGQLRTVLATFPVSVRDAAEPLFAELQADFTAQRERMLDVEAKLPAGDERRGQQVFLSTKAGCYSCHEIGYLGGEIGPDLTQIGRIRTKRDLLEAVMFPSASLVRSYESSTVLTDSGKTHSGLLRQKANGDYLIIEDPTRQIIVTADEVEEIRPSQTSVMPKGIDKVLSLQELADLLEFLSERK